MFRNIMVPIDGSSFSKEAVIQGLRIASNSGATLRLVRVGSVPAFVGVGGSDGVELENDRMKKMYSAELTELYSIAAECRAGSTVNVTASLQRGPVADALIGYAKRHRVDLIVMRSHARSGLARAWFGSVADTLIRESGIPVLVVRQPSIATALESGFRFQRILVPLDGSVLAEQALAPAAALARLNGASISLLGVVKPTSKRDFGELESTIGPAGANHVDDVKRYLDSLMEAETLKGIPALRRLVVADDIAETILSNAFTGEMDLIAIATRGRGAIPRAASGSVSDQVMREANVSVLVVHPEIRAVQRAEHEDGQLISATA